MAAVKFHVIDRRGYSHLQGRILTALCLTKNVLYGLAINHEQPSLVRDLRRFLWMDKSELPAFGAITVVGTGEQIDRFRLEMNVFDVRITSEEPVDEATLTS